jgi:hypothetical protein
MPETNEKPSQIPPPILGPNSVSAGPPPGAGPEAAPVPVPKRSSAPLGIGITLIAGGALLLLFSLGSLAVTFFVRSPAASAFVIQDKGVQVLQVVMPLVQSALCIVALVAGIGLVKYRAWGRSLSIGWAVVALADLVLGAVVTYAYVLPVTSRLMQSGTLPAGGEQAVAIGTTVGAAMSGFWTLILAVTPILTLIFMTGQGAKRSCTQGCHRWPEQP